MLTFNEERREEGACLKKDPMSLIALVRMMSPPAKRSPAQTSLSLSHSWDSCWENGFRAQIIVLTIHLRPQRGIFMATITKCA
jgi:hypothetical protein